MGAMGKYIAALTNEGRDRIISASVWIPYSTADGEGGGCLVGHGDGHAMRGHHSCDLSRAVHQRLQHGFHDWSRATHAFNHAIVRRPAKTVRAIKLRAARLNGCSPEQIRALLHEQPKVPA